MAERRMFAKSVVGSARFLRMPSTSRLLYYDLGMQADDDGIVEAFSVMRTTGATEDDLRVLASKGFVCVLNEDLVTYISDWDRNNYIQKDRYRPSIYSELLVQLGDGNQMYTECVQGVSKMDTQDRLGKDRLYSNFPDGKSDASPDEGEKDKRDVKPKRPFEHDSKPYKLAAYLARRITERLPNRKPFTETCLQSWALDFDRLNRIDGHEWQDIAAVLDFSQSDSFWRLNILSAGKFRKQYDQLWLKMKEEEDRDGRKNEC